MEISTGRSYKYVIFGRSTKFGTVVRGVLLMLLLDVGKLFDGGAVDWRLSLLCLMSRDIGRPGGNFFFRRRSPLKQTVIPNGIYIVQLN